MKKVATLYVGALVSLALEFGCASDPVPGNTTSPIVAGTPGSTTAGRTAAGASAAGSSAAASVTCGTKTCINQVALMAGAFASQIGSLFPGAKIATACCFDPTTSTCGFTDAATGTMCLPPIVADTRCPAPSVMGVMATPCCKPDGNCGTDLAALSLACGTLPFGAPPAQRCDAPLSLARRAQSRLRRVQAPSRVPRPLVRARLLVHLLVSPARAQQVPPRAPRQQAWAEPRWRVQRLQPVRPVQQAPTQVRAASEGTSRSRVRS